MTSECGCNVLTSSLFCAYTVAHVVQTAFDEARPKIPSGAWPLQDIIEISLTSDDIMTKTLPLVDAGLTASFKFRLWDFGKVRYVCSYA